MCKTETIERLSVCTTAREGECQNFLSKFQKTNLVSVTSRLTSAQSYSLHGPHDVPKAVLGAFAKLRKLIIIIVVMSVCLSFLLSPHVEN
jgi:hypothetical protein